MKKKYDDSDEAVLERFMKEFFPFSEFKKIGFFSKEMKGDYKAQSERVCKYFGYKTVYEYGAEESAPFHLSYSKGHRPKDEPFATTIPSIYK